MNDNQTINVTAQLDINNSLNKLQTDLNNLSRNLSPIKLQVSIDTGNAQKQIQSLSTQIKASQKQISSSTSTNEFVKSFKDAWTKTQDNIKTGATDVLKSLGKQNIARLPQAA